MISFTPAVDGGLVGDLVRAAQLGQGDRQGHRFDVGVLSGGRRAQAREVLGGRRDPALLLGGDEGAASGVDTVFGFVAVGALELVDEVARTGRRHPGPARG